MFEVLILLGLFILNGIFAMSELAVVSSRVVRLQHLANQGNTRAATALDLANNPNHFLSTVQVGITLIAILTGAFSGATLADRLAPQLEKISFLKSYSEPLAFTIIVVVTTYFSLVIGELVPKRLAMQYPEAVSMLVAGTMKRLAQITAPIVMLLSFSTDTILRLLPFKTKPHLHATEEDIKAMIQHGTHAGIFHQIEQEIVSKVFQLDDIRVDSVMTPYTELVWLDIHDSLSENLQKIADGGYKKFPVCDEKLDNVLGILYSDDLLPHLITKAELDLKTLLHAPLYVPASTPVSQVVQRFRKLGKNCALVMGEFSNIEGIMTLSDILEQLVGDVVPETPQAVQRQDGSWLLDGLLPLHELKEILEIDKLPNEDGDDFQTLGGFVMAYLDRVPRESDAFDWDGLHFEVVDMDGNRVDKVLYTHKPQTADTTS